MVNVIRRWNQLPRQRHNFGQLPWKRLNRFLIAAFLLFCVIGFYDDLVNMGHVPYVTTLVIAAISGLDAVLWVIAAAKLPWPSFVVLGALQFFLGPGLTRLANWMGPSFHLPQPTAEAGIRFSALGILVVTIGSYVLFVRFIRNEGRETMRIRNELELAHGIQKTLVPPISLRTPLFEVYGISKPSEQVGGDLVDAVLLPNGDVIAYLADIAGHGLSAGILMGMLKTAARTALLDAGAEDPRDTLPALLEKLNRVLPEVKEPQMYATITAFRLNADGSVWYAMAASPPVLHWSPQRRDLALVQSEQFPLGLLPVSGFTGEPIDVGAGDLLVVATDGVLEVCGKDDEEFGIARLEQGIEANAHKPPAELAASILERARTFGKQSDDQTLLVIRRIAGGG